MAGKKLLISVRRKGKDEEMRTTFHFSHIGDVKIYSSNGVGVEIIDRALKEGMGKGDIIEIGIEENEYDMYTVSHVMWFDKRILKFFDIKGPAGLPKKIVYQIKGVKEDLRER